MKLKGAAITLGIIACLITPNIAQATTYQGADRYETAALIAIDSGAKDITIASGENFPDALSAAFVGDQTLLFDGQQLPDWCLNAMEYNFIGGVDKEAFEATK